jgi:hypothetical protein
MFNQIMKAFKSDDKKKAEEIEIRLKSIIEEVREVLKRRGVNYYECMDIFNSMQKDLNFAIGSMLQKNQKEKEELMEANKILKLKQIDYESPSEPEKNSEQKAPE